MMDDELLANPQVAAATSRALLTIGGQMQFLLKHAQECENLRNDAIARANVLTAEVERLRAELANRPPGYLAALDARDEAQLYLTRIMAALDMVVNDTTYDEVAAEVERLKDENAALRAQLDAGEGWQKSRNARPADGQRVYSRTTTIAIYHAEDGYFHVDGVYGWYESEWRPAPPQE